MCLLSVVIVGLIQGCSTESAAPTATPEAAAVAPAAPALKPDVPQTPDAAVKLIVDGLKASKPVAAWDAIPESGQRSVNTSISTSAAQVDPEVWQRTVANLKKLATLLETKKEFILASPLWKSGRQLPKLDQVQASYDPLTKLLRTVVDSELVDQNKMKEFNGHAFFEGTGAKVLAEVRALTKTFKPDPLAMIDTLKVTVEKESDTAAKVLIPRPDPKAKPISLSLAIIDGRWTSPQLEMGAGFAGGLLMAYTQPFRPYHLIEWKANYLKDMDRLGKILDNLQAAKTSADFQEVMGGQFLPFALQKGGQLRAKPRTRTATQMMSLDRKANTAMVIVKGLHSFEEPTYAELTKSLRTLSPATFRGPLELEGATLFFIGPADSIFDRTVKAIQVGKIVEQDKPKDTVTVELPTSLKDESTTADAAAKSKK